MKKTESEQTVMPDAELDTVLAQMADEVPPMPADFHDRWMNAVRADAQNAVSREGSAPDRTARGLEPRTDRLSRPAGQGSSALQPILDS